MKNNDLKMLREIEDNERWLAEIETPTASPEAISSVRQAVRAELARSRNRQFAIRWRPWQGAIAAAAMLMLSVGVVRFAAMHTQPSEVPDIQTALGDLSIISQTETSIEDDSLDQLSEMKIGESWALSGTSMYETFEEALSDDGGDDVGEAGAMAPNHVANGAIG